MLNDRKTITTFDHGFSMIRNADVEVIPTLCSGKPAAKIIVGVGDNMSFEHLFNPKSSVSRALELGADKIAQQLRGGNFFFHNNNLVCYRDANYKGFVHTDESIGQLIEHIGYSEQFPQSMRHSNSTDKIRLVNQYSKVEMNIEQYGIGGEMDSCLSFAWDPFQTHISAVFQLVRLICTNGMTGLADFMNAKIPVISDWVEHMAIANAQIQNKITSMVHRRMQHMAVNRASVRDCQRITDACHARLNDVGVHQNDEAVKRIREIALVADPRLHLNGHYSDRVFDDRRLGDQAASHLTEFTAWNLLTELASHTNESANSSNLALHKHANELLIARGDDRMKTVVSNMYNTRANVGVKFDDLDAAFAGDLLAQL